MEVLEFDLHGVTVYMYADDYEAGNGALMPTRDHATETFGMGQSYAHLFEDGIIRRGQREIGTKDDLIQPGEIVIEHDQGN